MCMLCAQAARKHRVACKVRCETCSAAHTLLKITIPSLSDCGGPTVDLQCMGGAIDHHAPDQTVVDTLSIHGRHAIDPRSSRGRLTIDCSPTCQCKVGAGSTRTTGGRSSLDPDRSPADPGPPCDSGPMPKQVDCQSIQPVSIRRSARYRYRSIRGNHGSAADCGSTTGRPGSSRTSPGDPERPQVTADARFDHGRSGSSQNQSRSDHRAKVDPGSTSDRIGLG